MVFGKVLNSAEGGCDALADLESFQNIGLPHNLRVQLGLLRMQGKERPAESGLSESLIWRKTTNSGANLWQRKALHSNLPVPYWATTDSHSHLQLDVFFKLHLMEHPSHCTVTLLLPDCWKSPSYLIHKNFRLIEDICWKRNLVWKSVETFHHCWFYQLGFQHQDLQQHQMIKLLFIELEEIEYL